jgi:F0F1-type ATP synthase assembly protein I
MPFHRAIPEQKPPAKASGGFSAYVEAEKLVQIAFILPSAVVIGWVMGWWADNHFHQSWVEIAGAVFGCVAGLTYMIRTALDAEKKSRPGNTPQNGTGKGNTDLQP